MSLKANVAHGDKNHASFIWSIADLLRGDYKPYEYGKVILPLTVIRRLDAVLEPTRGKVEAAFKKYGDREAILIAASGVGVYNTSGLSLKQVLNETENLADALREYLAGYSATARDILEKFNFDVEIERLDQADLLYLILSEFCQLDMSLKAVSNIEMGYLYEELIRRFSELYNETAGEHFTPREVIRLMVELLLVDDNELLSREGIVKTLYDPACGTGGMLSVAEDRVRELNPAATLHTYGQELNPETYAICRSDMIIKGQDPENIADGNSFSEDAFDGETFDYALANPPFGVEWKKVEKFIKKEHADEGYDGRFGAGLPRIDDGSILFLQHMISKMKRPAQGGSRVAIVFNGSPLFSGKAQAGPSEVRRWIIENDWLEAVVALPDQLFYNTPISTYFWIVSNRKSSERRGKVQIFDARSFFTKLDRNLGKKRKEVSPGQIASVAREYCEFQEGKHCKIVENHELGYQLVTTERPLRLRFFVDAASLTQLETDKAVAKLAPEDRSALLQVVQRELGNTYDSKEHAATAGRTIITSLGIDSKGVSDALLSAFSHRDRTAEPQRKGRRGLEPDPELRDSEIVPLPSYNHTFEEDPSTRLKDSDHVGEVNSYVEREVTPFVAEAWVDHSKTKIGYEIPVTQFFYQYIPPRDVDEIDAEVRALRRSIDALIDEGLR